MAAASILHTLQGCTIPSRALQQLPLQMLPDSSCLLLLLLLLLLSVLLLPLREQLCSLLRLQQLCVVRRKWYAALC